MSIINDALKKVQSNLNQNTINPTNKPMTTPPPENSENPNPPQQNPQPNYDPGLEGQTKAPWDVGAVAPTPTPQATPTEPQKNVAKEKPTPQKSVQYRENNKSSRVIILVVVLFLVIVATIFTFQKNNKFNTSNFSFKLPSSVTGILSKKSQASAPAQSAGAFAPNSAFNIGGVMQRDNQYIALINDKIYKTGSTVNGMKILRINLEEIVVLEGDIEKTIPVNAN